jgi:hypothetical protein
LPDAPEEAFAIRVLPDQAFAVAPDGIHCADDRGVRRDLVEVSITAPRAGWSN